MSLVGKVVLVGGVYVVYRYGAFYLRIYRTVKKVQAERQTHKDACSAADIMINLKRQNGDYEGKTATDIAQDRLFYIQAYHEGL